jgi:hypothetical protein
MLCPKKKEPLKLVLKYTNENLFWNNYVNILNHDVTVILLHNRTVNMIVQKGSSLRGCDAVSWTQCHNPVDLNLHQPNCGNLKPCIIHLWHLWHVWRCKNLQIIKDKLYSSLPLLLWRRDHNTAPFFLQFQHFTLTQCHIPKDLNLHAKRLLVHTFTVWLKALKIHT